MDKGSIVKKSERLVLSKNKFAQSKKNRPLGIIAHKVEAFLISKIDRREQALGVIRLSRKELIECGVKVSQFRRDIRTAFRELANTELILENLETGRTLETRLASSIERDFPDGSVEFSFDPKLTPYLLDLKGHYCRFSLDIALGLSRSSYSLALYKLLSTFIHNNVDYAFRELELSELKHHLGCQNKYTGAFQNFSKRVLKPAVAELNSNSDFKVDYTLIKEGRTYTRIKFEITRQPYQQEIQLLTNEELIPEEVIAKLDEFGYKLNGAAKDFILEVCTKHDADEICHALKLLDHDYCDAPMKVRGGIIKKQLKSYLERAVNDLACQERIRQAALADTIQMKAQEAYQKKVEAAVEHYRLFNDCSELEAKVPSFIKSESAKERWVNREISVIIEPETGTLADMVEQLSKRDALSV